MRKMLPLRKLIRIHYGRALKSDARDEAGKCDVYGSSGKVGTHTETLTKHPTIIIGRKGSVGEITYAYNGGWTIDTAFYIELIDQSQLDLRYLYYSLRTLNLKRHTITTSIPGINRNDIYDACIPLPPLPEQKRIAAILDKADAIRRKREKAIELTDSFLRSVFLEMFGDPARNPHNWDLYPLSVLTSKIGSGATPRGGDASYKDSGITLIRSMNVHRLRFQKKGLAFIDDEQADNLKNVVVQEEDVLLNITGASVCRCCVVDFSVLPARVNQHVSILRTKQDKLDPYYLAFLLNSDNSQTFLLNKARSSGATREALTKIQLEELNIPVASIEEQKKFRKIYEKTKKIINNQKSGLAGVINLCCSLQHEMFVRSDNSMFSARGAVEAAHAL